MATLKRRPSILVILRRAYLNLAGGNHCAAKLIEYFKHWREWKLKHHRTEWIYMPLKYIYEDLMCEHSLHVIRAAIAYLSKLKILEKRNNPDNGQDKTYQYKLNLNILQSLLKSEYRECNSERSEYNVEQHTQDQSSIVLATTNTTLPVEKEVLEETNHEKPTRNPNVVDTPCSPPLHEASFGLDYSSQKCRVDDVGSDSLKENLITNESSTPPPLLIKLLERVKFLGVPDTDKIRKLLSSCPLHQAQMNVTALENLATKKGLNNPVAAFISAIKNNWKPHLIGDHSMLTNKDVWWKEAAVIWGREKRDKLFSALTELHGETLLFLTNGKTIEFEDVQSMSWEMIEAIALKE